MGCELTTLNAQALLQYLRDLYLSNVKAFLQAGSLQTADTLGTKILPLNGLFVPFSFSEILFLVSMLKRLLEFLTLAAQLLPQYRFPFAGFVAKADLQPSRAQLLTTVRILITYMPFL